MNETTGLLYAYSRVSIYTNDYDIESSRYGWLILYTDPILSWFSHQDNQDSDIKSFESLEQELLNDLHSSSYSVTLPQYLPRSALILPLLQLSTINILNDDLCIIIKDNWTFKFENSFMFQCFIETLKCHVTLIQQTSSLFKVKSSAKQSIKGKDSAERAGWAILGGLSSIAQKARHRFSFMYQDNNLRYRPTMNDPKYLDFFQNMHVPEITTLHSISFFSFQNDDVDAIKIFSNGGIRSPSNNHHLRKLFWPVLLQIYQHATDNLLIYQDLSTKYTKLSSQWQNILPEQELAYFILHDRQHKIQKDVLRTDQHLSFYRSVSADPLILSSNSQILSRILLTWSYYESENIDGYVQGMSDLASPILYIIQDEPLAFWCFAKWMKHCASYFHKSNELLLHDLNIISMLIHILLPDLHNWLTLNTINEPSCSFCYRWLLVRFRREFTLDPDLLNLWEVLWTNSYSSRYHLFICIGILSLHQEKITKNNDINKDELLFKYVHHDMKLNLNDVLLETERLFLKFKYIAPFIGIKELEELIL